MIDKDKVRSVVARFFNVPEAAVTEGFVFPSERLQGSVGRATFHAAIKRMAGTDLASAFSAANFGELFALAQAPGIATTPATAGTANPTRQVPLDSVTAADAAVGIDIEHCVNMPVVADPWTDAFFVENFTPAEIAYCQRQPRPRESFCGLWCAKEAAMKCGADFMKLRPVELEIRHDAEGRPMLAVLHDGKQEVKRDCVISISHSREVCVAVCVVGAGGGKTAVAPGGLAGEPKPAGSGENTLAWVAVGLGVLNLLVWVWHLVKR